MPPAVLRVALALDEASLLELVEQPDELPAVVAERVGDRALRLVRPSSSSDEDARSGTGAGPSPRMPPCARSLAVKPSRFSRNVVRGDQLLGQARKRRRAGDLRRIVRCHGNSVARPTVDLL